MKKAVLSLLACCLLSTSIMVFAQDQSKTDNMKHDDMKSDTMKHDDMKSDQMKSDDNMKK